MNSTLTSLAEPPVLRVAVVERDGSAPRRWVPCVIGGNLDFSTERLESYCFSSWKPIVFDALLVAAAVEFCDRIKKRPVLGWGRQIELRVPVHDMAHWSSKPVIESLTDALNFLTGDCWRISFMARKTPESPPGQTPLPMPPDVQAIIPFSDGMDSRAVAGLVSRELGARLVRVRLGAKTSDQSAATVGRQPFTTIPYRVMTGRSNGETSARSRGFKFATVSGVAAYLVGAREIIVPESGQGALGSALVAVGHGYEDYRNHPLFADRMMRYFKALFGLDVQFRFPRLWHTKGQTLAAYAESAGAQAPVDAWSCWQQSRQVSVSGRRRQCGICAACMLRRQSVHAAGLSEAPETYVWEDLGAPTFELGAAKDFKKVTRALRQYAIAGALHLDHLASLRGMEIHRASLRKAATLLAGSQRLAADEAESKLNGLLAEHQREWQEFVGSLGPRSFVADWIATAA